MVRTFKLANLMSGECLFQVAEIEVSYNPKTEAGPALTNTQDAVKCLSLYFDTSTIALQEQFIVVYLNNVHKVIGVYKHSKGGMNATLVDVRLVMATGLKLAAQKMILAHNHPSGRLYPSNADLQLTEKLKKAGEILDIEIVDHIILDRDFNPFSFCGSDLL